ncbi:hypothetical protein PLESTF_000052600 [Pleodorina starrii]|nr:hypothetical protein PLESTM_001586300 [Pleodorina starrii]GLC63588.1 hypothetical protein PLESTF_000052600 [Pleodorina starrii]
MRRQGGYEVKGENQLDEDSVPLRGDKAAVRGTKPGLSSSAAKMLKSGLPSSISSRANSRPQEKAPLVANTVDSTAGGAGIVIGQSNVGGAVSAGTLPRVLTGHGQAAAATGGGVKSSSRQPSNPGDVQMYRNPLAEGNEYLLEGNGGQAGNEF